MSKLYQTIISQGKTILRNLKVQKSSKTNHLGHRRSYTLENNCILEHTKVLHIYVNMIVGPVEKVWSAIAITFSYNLTNLKIEFQRAGSSLQKFKDKNM